MKDIASVAQVAMGSITIEGLMLPNGDYAVAVLQIFDLFGEGAGFSGAKNQASQELKHLMGEDFQMSTIRTESGGEPVSIVTLDQSNYTLTYLADHLSCGMWVKTPRKTMLKFPIGHLRAIAVRKSQCRAAFDCSQSSGLGR